MTTATLKTYARPYSVTVGALKGFTLWMLPYRLLLVDKVIIELQAIDPQWVYVHPDGRRVTEEPEDYRAERERVEDERQKVIDRAAKLNSPPNADRLAAIVNKSAWKQVYNWSLEHRAFWRDEPVLIAVDPPEDDSALSTEASAFLLYWKTRPADVAGRWALFRIILGTDTFNALSDAYEATRDTQGAGAKELAEAEVPADPKDAPLTTAPDGILIAS